MLRSLASAVRRRPKTTALVLLLLGAAVAGLYGYGMRQWEQAQIAVKQNRPTDARSRLRLCLWLWPRSVAVHVLAARAARLDGDFSAAEYHLNRARQLHGGPSEAIQLEFLLMRVQTGEVDEVAPTLRQSVDEGHPEAPLILETMARFYMHHLRYRDAFGCLERWTQVEPDNATPYFWRGWILERMNNAKAAAREYHQALEIDPDHVSARLRIAEMYLEENQPIEAARHLDRLRRLAPERVDIMARLGQCRFLQGQWQEARRLLEAAAPQMPNDPTLLIHLAKLDLRDGAAKQAEERLRRVLKLDPADTEARYQLAQSLQAQKRFTEAEAAARQYREYKALLDKANKLLKEEAEKPSTDAARPAEIGRLLLSIDQDRLGLFWLEEALRREPDHKPAHEALSRHYQKKGDAKKAEEHRRRAGGAGERRGSPPPG